MVLMPQNCSVLFGEKMRSKEGKNKKVPCGFRRTRRKGIQSVLERVAGCTAAAAM